MVAQRMGYRLKTAATVCLKCLRRSRISPGGLGSIFGPRRSSVAHRGCYVTLDFI